MADMNVRRLTDAEFRACAEQALAKAGSLALPQPLSEEQKGPWFIVHVVGKTDAHAVDWLGRAGIETFYPMVLQMKKVPRMNLSKAQRASGIEIKRPQKAPLFPRYIFARLMMGNAFSGDIFSVAGIGGMICKDNAVVRIDEQLIEQLRQRAGSGAIDGKETTRIVFGIGEGVTVTDGPFASFPGTIEQGIDKPIEQLDPDDRIKVAVSIFGRLTPVELAVWQVTKR